jgi:WD40 repeat protein
MDVTEIKIPFCIASASLDKTIRLYNLAEKFLLTVLTGHKTGVRSISYISNFGGFFVSVGHEPYVYVWSPETAVKRAFVGKLKGYCYIYINYLCRHTDPVVEARFLPKTTLIVSIDERLVVKIFDVYTFECKQTIAPTSYNNYIII